MTAKKKPTKESKPAKKKAPRDDVNQAAARIEREATEMFSFRIGSVI